MMKQLLPLLFAGILVQPAPAGDAGHKTAGEGKETPPAAAAAETGSKPSPEAIASPSAGVAAASGGETHEKKLEALAVEGNRGCLPSQAVIEDLRRRREELSAEMSKLSEREKEFAVKEKALDEELKKLKDMKDEILASRELQGKLKAENIERLGQTLETMLPKVSAQILVTIDESLAVAAMEKVSAPKLAKIMNVMEADKSTRLLERLAGVIRGRKSSSSSNTNAIKEAGNGANSQGNRMGSVNPNTNSTSADAGGRVAPEVGTGAAGAGGTREPAGDLQKAASR